MTEGTGQYGNAAPVQNLESAAQEFRSKVEDAAARLSSAAQQFVTMSDSLNAAVAEARQAADRAQSAQAAMEQMRDQMASDYGSVSGLVRDLQERISALAVLARPFGVEGAGTTQPEPGAQQESQPEGHGEPQQQSWEQPQEQHSDGGEQPQEQHHNGGEQPQSNWGNPSW